MVPVLRELVVFRWRGAVRAQCPYPAAVTRAREMGRWVCVRVTAVSLVSVTASGLVEQAVG